MKYLAFEILKMVSKVGWSLKRFLGCPKREQNHISLPEAQMIQANRPTRRVFHDTAALVGWFFGPL